MALGDITQIINGTSYKVEILASRTTTNGAPSGASDGVDIGALSQLGRVPPKLRVGVVSTAGSGTMTVTLRAWLYDGASWIVAKPLNAASTAPQTAVAIAETSADSISYSELVEVMGAATRIYLEVVAIAGTSTAVTGYAWIGRSDLA